MPPVESAASSGRARQHGAHWGIAGLLAVFTTVAFYINLQVNTGLSDDHAGYLAMARQIALGELPIRDFVDLGAFLHIWLSAAAAQTGPGLLPEMAMSWAFIAAGEAVAVYLVWRSTGSLTAAALAGLTALLLYPRLYSFPKVFVYPVTVWMLWRYVERPARARLWGLALWAAVALLLRFDHGAAVFAAAVGTIALTRGPRAIGGALRDITEFAAAFAVWLTPFWLYLAMSIGVRRHLTDMLAFGQYGLDERERFTWRPLFGEPWLGGEHALAFLFYVIVLLTVAAVTWAGLRLVRDYRTNRQASVRTLQLCAVVGLWLTSAPMLVRNNLAGRIPDAGTLLVILAALLAVPWRSLGVAPSPRRRRLHAGFALAITAFVVVAIARIELTGGVPLKRLAALFSPEGLERAEGIIEELRTEPLVDAWADPGVHGTGGLARYLHECTQPEDRILVPFFKPLLYVYAERGFAGGQWRFLPRFHNSTEDQKAALRKLGTERVPVAIVHRSEWESFRAEWPLLVQHVESRYQRIEDYQPEGENVEVWVERNRVPSTMVDGTVPCYR